MAEKRTILKSEDQSRVTPPTIGARVRKSVGALRQRAEVRGMGISTTLGSVQRQGKPDAKFKLRAGVLRGAGTGSRKTQRKYGTERKGHKPIPGIRFEVKF